MQNQDANQILDFLKNGLWEGKGAALPLEALSPELRPVGEELNRIAGWVAEYLEFAQAISRGNLDAGAAWDNRLCWPLKELRSNLSHLTWQTQQVAKGDYQQRVAFLGEFSEGFNTMVRQLQGREQQLKQAAALLTARADRLEEANGLIGQIVSCTRDWMLVLDLETHEVLFQNHSAEQMEHVCEGCTAQRMDAFNGELQALLAGIRHPGELQVPRLCRKSLLINSYEIDWSGRKSLLHIITDVTRQRQYDEELINFAYTDPLTGLYNRRFCTKTLSELTAAHTPFVLCFADVDDLKQVNDQYGHPAGDAYLMAVVEGFRRCFRKEDIVCRVGGDGFAAVLRGGSAAVAARRLEAVRILLRAGQESAGFSMDISYGITEVEGGTSLSGQELLNLADEKMYQQKNEHKLRAQPFPPPAPDPAGPPRQERAGK